MRILSTLLSCLMFLSVMPAAKAQSMALSTSLLTVEPHQRTAAVTVSNQSAKDQRYRVSVVDMVMGSNGEVSALGEDVATPDRSARSWVIVSPSSLRLGPGQSQTVRLLFRRPANVSDGEYRTYLKVAQEPPATISGGLDEAQHADGMQINIVMVYSTTIPIVFMQGQHIVSASISDAQRIDPGNLSLTVERAGNASFRGFARVTAADNSAVVNMPIVIYPELDRITATYKLNALADTTGPLTLTLHEGLIPRKEGAEEVSLKTLDTFTVVR